MAARAEPPPPPPPLVPIEWKAERGLTQQEAKQYLPPGAKIRKMTQVKRWQIEAPAYLVPSMSMAYRAESWDSDNHSLSIVLAAAWHARVLFTGERCPWDLGVPLF